MGLLHWLRAMAEMPAKRRYLHSMGFRRTQDGDWVAHYSGGRMRGRDVRRWTLSELKFNYTHYMF